MIELAPFLMSDLVRLDLRREGEWMVVAPRGELDLATVPLLARKVMQLRAVGFKAIRLDLRGLTFADSSAVHYVMALVADLDDELRVDLIAGPANVQRVFELAGVADLLPFGQQPEHAAAAGS